MEEEQKKVLETIEFNGRNKNLIATRYTHKPSYCTKERECWEIRDENGEYVSSMDNGIGKFYSSSFGELRNFKQFISIWKKRWVLPYLREGTSFHGESYLLDLFSGKEISEKEFDKLMADTFFLLEQGETIGYNDEHGVGYFEMSGGKIIATHYRWGTERKETLDKNGLKSFVRSFFDLGYHYDKKDDWSA